METKRRMNSSTCQSRQLEPSLSWSCVLIFLLVFGAGCVAEKKSLHEMDHELPPHWPLHMEDAAKKIEQRLSGSQDKESAEKVYQEVLDLIEWAPEVAADTNLSEADWVPIHELSETLRNHLRSNDISIDDCREDLERFIALLRESHAKLPDTTLTKLN